MLNCTGSHTLQKEDQSFKDFFYPPPLGVCVHGITEALPEEKQSVI